MANWGKISSRGNVEDRRGFGPVGVGGFSLTTVAILFVVNYLTGGNLTDVLLQLESVPTQQQTVTDPAFEGEDTYEVFAATVLGSNNAVWEKLFAENNKTYAEPKLVLFRSATQSGCGVATSQVGPHYCPLDKTIYLDETFFEALVEKLGATGGDVAEAYVIAHEVGHHVQNELGLMEEMRRAQERNPQKENELSIQLELQADCFAGIWAHSLKDQDIFLPGEINEAMNAAEAVGDDRIQEKVQGYSNPETWTHGSSEQRVEWFNRGFETGSLVSCTTP